MGSDSLRKVALAFQDGWHGEGVVDPILIAQVIGREKEEKLLPVLVKTGARNDYGTANGAAWILIAVALFGDAVFVIKELVGVKHLVTPIIEGASVKLRCAALDGESKLAARASPVLRRVIGNQ